MNELDSVANILSLFPDQNQDSYVVDVSNPVCPCCGAKLVLNDGITAAQSDELATGAIQESWVKRGDVIPLVHETAMELVDAYLEDEAADPKELMLITDSVLVKAIKRKAIELQSLLETNYEIKIQPELLATYIKNDIRNFAKYNK